MFLSVRVGTVFVNLPLALRKWLTAIYQQVSSLKGVVSMKLYREFGITQKTAWLVEHRIREMFLAIDEKFVETVETDENYVSGLEKNKQTSKYFIKAGV